MNKKILFVLHDAALMGAPMVLLHLIRWIKTNTAMQAVILLKDGGPLLDKFALLGDVYMWRPDQLPGSTGRRILSKINMLIKGKPLYVPFPKSLKHEKFDLIYLNTADTTALAPMLKRYFSCPVIAHIHELAYSIAAYYPNALAEVNRAAIDHYIAASDGVEKYLNTSCHIPNHGISVCNEFIPIKEIAGPTTSAEEIKQELGLTGKFVAGGSGSAGWRKGTDIFIRLAYLVNRSMPQNNIVFLWIGHQSQEAAAQSAYEIEKSGLEGKVIFTGSKASPQNYFQVFDVFALTSREDPFPLVALEAAALSKPVYCFRDSGGIPEIITDETGQTFEYGNLQAMADAIAAAALHPQLVLQKGTNAAKLVAAYDVDVIAPKIAGLINRISS